MDQIIDFMIAHPILINRPIRGDIKGGTAVPSVRAVLDILPNPNIDRFIQRRRRGHHRREREFGVSELDLSLQA